jgi:dTDP-4-amino-4,6-dideoxygalactose transaminase
MSSMINDNIPFLDLITPHQELHSELLAVFAKALATAGFIGGPMVEGFEGSFATYCGTKHCIGVGSGTDALRFALIAAGVKPEEVVVTVPNTFIATTEAISQAGAVPEFVDVDEHTSTMDPTKLRRYLEEQCQRDASTGRVHSNRSGLPVTAIVPVHLYGHMADMDPLLALAEEYDLIVVEDACQAHGARYFSEKDQCWKQAGTLGTAAAFSFYPGKNLGSCGEAGAVTTNDEQIARSIRTLRDHGQSRKYYHEIEGYNGRLDSIQAGILSVKLQHLDDWNQKRREIARTYHSLFADCEAIIVPMEAEWSESVYHLYVVRVGDREGLIAALAESKIGTGIHYPVPLHLQNAYRNLGYTVGDFPISERLASEIVSLPMYPTLTLDQQRSVADQVVKFLAQSPELSLEPASAS